MSINSLPESRYLILPCKIDNKRNNKSAERDDRKNIPCNETFIRGSFSRAHIRSGCLHMWLGLHTVDPYIVQKHTNAYILIFVRSA